MNQKKPINESEEGGLFDVISKMYDMERRNAAISRLETSDHIQERNMAVETEWIDWGAIDIREEFIMTTISAFTDLWDDLIEGVKATRDSLLSR